MGGNKEVKKGRKGGSLERKPRKEVINLEGKKGSQEWKEGRKGWKSNEEGRKEGKDGSQMRKEGRKEVKK